jgi:hypothetical protein
LKNSEEPYSFYSIADYACAKIVNHLVRSDYQNGHYNSIISCYYLQQVRRFSEFCATPLSKENRETVLSFYEQLFQKASPLQHLVITEFLYVQYKRVLLNNLKRKYKIIGSERELTFDRQFLNISAFYNFIPIKKIELNKKQ